jgi:hypothetical protein
LVAGLAELCRRILSPDFWNVRNDFNWFFGVFWIFRFLICKSKPRFVFYFFLSRESWFVSVFNLFLNDIVLLLMNNVRLKNLTFIGFFLRIQIVFLYPETWVSVLVLVFFRTAHLKKMFVSLFVSFNGEQLNTM